MAPTLAKLRKRGFDPANAETNRTATRGPADY